MFIYNVCIQCCIYSATTELTPLGYCCYAPQTFTPVMFNMQFSTMPVFQRK